MTAVVAVDGQMVVDVVGTALRQITKKATGEVMGTVLAVRQSTRDGRRAWTDEVNVWGDLGAQPGDVLHVRGRLSPSAGTWTGRDGRVHAQLRLDLNDFELVAD